MHDVFHSARTLLSGRLKLKIFWIGSHSSTAQALSILRQTLIRPAALLRQSLLGSPMASSVVMMWGRGYGVVVRGGGNGVLVGGRGISLSMVGYGRKIDTWQIKKVR